MAPKAKKQQQQRASGKSEQPDRSRTRSRSFFAESAIQHPVHTLICIFFAWKAVLLLLVTLSPGVGYDTSTSLLLQGEPSANRSLASTGETLHQWSIRSSSGFSVVSRLARWDAVYYARSAQRGYVFEQEWAFGWGFTRLVKLLTRGISMIGMAGGSPRTEIVVAILVANVSHLLSVIVLYHLSGLVFAVAKGRKKLAFLSCLFHIISPAGVFLSAPYSESLFSLLNFAGTLIYTKSSTPFAFQEVRSWKHDVLLVLSGVAFGFANTVRSNGLLNGIMYFWDVVEGLSSLYKDGVTFPKVTKMLALMTAGTFVGLGTVVPQWIAYWDFCGKEKSPQWCSRMIPSIYAYVQDHYWNVGFMRYWTFSNLPLFLLAVPMLLIMVVSSVWALLGGPANDWDGNITVSEKWAVFDHLAGGGTGPSAETPLLTQEVVRKAELMMECLLKFALPQLVLTILAFTTYHVQIITRISSGYMVWYWWLAFCACGEWKIKVLGKQRNISHIVARFLVLYAIVQGGLFASFLPPA